MIRSTKIRNLRAENEVIQTKALLAITEALLAIDTTLGSILRELKNHDSDREHQS